MLTRERYGFGKFRHADKTHLMFWYFFEFDITKPYALWDE